MVGVSVGAWRPPPSPRAGAARATGRGAGPAAPRSPRAAGRGERGRLRPPPPAEVHAPLLLGLDAEGVEHPQGPEDPDDESLVGRCWGCACGWRGTVRDVATRHFRPQVGDGGGLRRRRLARADRDARSELEHHLAATTPLPMASSIPAVAAAVSPRGASADATGRARGPRRRLTLPRTTPPDSDASTPAPPPAGDATSIEPPPAAHLPAEEPAIKPGPQPPTEPDQTTDRALTTAADAEPQPAAGGRTGGVLDETATPAPAAAAGAGADQGALAAAATRAAAARAELAAAETALNAAVAAARADGASWRTIARATGVPHREAAARWDPESAGPSL